ncbi:hypothetical protein DV711_06095 [Motiliproteus coralliicola]|uniref:Uncharacterized protein n=1 Tax=Motiliproteus coralliicola TaxID=2283196 RepID=A0A369X025_9GAMM|nr:hypothetical protein [Motiliproteus coralliicola]RDE25125.1 hypothetical protein DV711_06095 [Motiliproteus coralliicola]
MGCGPKGNKQQETSQEKAQAEASREQYDISREIRDEVEPRQREIGRLDHTEMLRGRNSADVAQANRSSTLDSIQAGGGTVRDAGVEQLGFAKAKTVGDVSARETAQGIKDNARLDLVRQGQGHATSAQSGMQTAAKIANREAQHTAALAADDRAFKKQAVMSLGMAGASDYMAYQGAAKADPGRYKNTSWGFGSWRGV